MKTIVGILLLSCFFFEAFGFGVQYTHSDGVSYENHALFRVHVSKQSEHVTLRKIQSAFNKISSDEEFDPLRRVDVWPDHDVKQGDNLIRVPPAVVQVFEAMLKSKGLRYTVVTKNLQEAINTEARFNQLQADDDFFSTYRTYEDFEALMHNLATTYPTIAQTVYLGSTYEGRNITAIHISGPSATLKRGFAIIGGQHAREWIAPATVAYIMNTLVTQYNVDSTITSIVDGLDFYIVPLSNPDGYTYTQSDRMWRKNRSRDRTTCYGVDNNRNWAYEWNTGGSSGISCSETYHGPKAFSEKENIALSQFMSSKSNIDAFIDFHSYGQLFMNPWGWTDDVTPDNEAQQQVSTAGAAAIKAVHGKVYEVGTDVELTYIASGGSDDWAYGTCGAKYSYTIELRDTGQYGFLLPANQIVPTGEEAFAGVQSIAEFLLTL